MAALQYVHVPNYRALILRKNFADLALPGAVMDRAEDWLRGSGAKWVDKEKSWLFPSGASLTFGYLEYERQKYRYQGAEFQFIAFDELTQFPEAVYRYLFSRLRRLVGVEVPIRMRTASNPGGVGHHWVKERFVDPLTRDAEAFFIPAKLSDNPYLDQAEYGAMLDKLDLVTRRQLKDGDWDVLVPGNMFKREWMEVVDEAYAWNIGRVDSVRFWDFAATESVDADFTVGTRLSRLRGNVYIVEAVDRFQLSPFKVQQRVRERALEDKGLLGAMGEAIGIEQEPGASGKTVVDTYKRLILPEYTVTGKCPSGDKTLRARPLSALAESGNLKVARGAWNAAWFDEMEAFPNEAIPDDQVDSATGAHRYLIDKMAADAMMAGPLDVRPSG